MDPTLPRKSNAANRRIELPPGGHETILVVEDEPLVLRHAARILRERGYSVHPATGPKEALALFEDASVTIDLVLTDVVMPEMNGRQMIDVLRAKHPRLRYMFMSGYPEDVVAQHGVLEPGIAFVEKPFTSASLAAKIREALDSKTL